jgi:nucleoside-diphosphate-sugar epimerase
MPSILITGSNGFIGSHLVLKLLQTNYRISVLNRSPTTNPIFKTNKCFGDFCYDGSESSINIALQETQPDVVIHLASYFIPRHSPEDAKSLIISNVDFPCKLLESMSQMGIKKFINTGTYWQHYQNSHYDPVSLYAATKQAFEDILIYYVNSQKIDAITLKLFDTYGGGDTRRKVLNLLIDAATTQEKLKLSPGEQKLNLVHVRDVVSAYEVALKILLNRSGYTHISYGISHSEIYSLQELAVAVEQVTGYAIQAEWGALPYRDREVMEPWSNYEKLPGWQASISLEEGLKMLVANL